MLSFNSLDKKVNYLEKLIEKLNLTTNQLYNLYTLALLEDKKYLKENFSGGELELSLTIKYLIENKFPVNKIKYIVEKYLERKDLIKLITNNKELFNEESDMRKLIDFLNNKTDKIFISVPLDNNFFVEISYNSKTYEIIKDYIYSSLEVKNIDELLFYKLKIK